MTVAQTDRDTHKGTDIKTQEETNRHKKLRRRGSGTTSGHKEIYSIKKVIIFLSTYFLVSVEFFIGFSTVFYCKCIYYYSITYVTYIYLAM